MKLINIFATSSYMLKYYHIRASHEGRRKNENVNVMSAGCLSGGCLLVGCLLVGCLYGCLHVEVLVLCAGYANNVRRRMVAIN